jgi:hypothetical protein
MSWNTELYLDTWINFRLMASSRQVFSFHWRPAEKSRTYYYDDRRTSTQILNTTCSALLYDHFIAYLILNNIQSIIV